MENKEKEFYTVGISHLPYIRVNMSSYGRDNGEAALVPFFQYSQYGSYNRFDTVEFSQGKPIDLTGIAKQFREKPYLFVKYETGGVAGGSCWDSSDPQPYSIDEEDLEDDFDVLDEFLTENAPNLTFLQYRETVKQFIHTDSYSENEYYGNCTDFGVKYVVLTELIPHLKKIGVWEGPV